MKHSLSILVAAMLVTAPLASVEAGPIMKMLEEKKAKQAAGTNPSATPTPQAPLTAAPASKNSAFESAKVKCKELGNKEGSDKFNSCVMTLME